jgi:4-hydroxy-3-polyprenylbenzoate decarboxylase
MVFSRNPDTGKRNCGMYRMQVFDERTTGHALADAQAGRGALSPHESRRQETRMDVAVAIGADPATMYSAILPLPPDLDEMMIAGFLRGSPVEMVKCQTNDLEVPATPRSCSKATSNLGELRTEGPFGDHTGFYSLADEYPVFHVTCITQRKNRSTRPPLSARRPWRISTWARRSSAFSCR